MASIKANSRLSQPETVSRFETVGEMLRSAKASASGEAALEQPRYPRTRKSYGNRHRTACLRNAHSGKARWRSGQPIQKICLQDRKFQTRLLRGWNRCG